MQKSALFSTKNFGFFKIYIWCVPLSAQTRRLSQCRHFVNKEEGANFSRFCVDIFYGQSLTIFLNHLEN